MAFTNLYTPPVQKISADEDPYGPDPYDLNYTFPINVESLETERVALTPFIPSIHAKAFWNAIAPCADELFRYYPFKYKSLDDILTFFELHIRRDPTRVMFAVIDKTTPDPIHPEFGGGSLAGVVGLFSTSASDLRSEIGHVLTFPAFQRTHVTGNAIGVLVKYCMDKPSASPPGLGLRRLQWYCHPDNAKSARLAEKMGMRREGVLRWNAVIEPDPALVAHGRLPAKDDRYPDKPGRGTLVLAVCWDEWEAAREKVQAIIDRP
ncbi:acyl-CoA N-acyltransferase [Cristinia sonorae]|uniref:Acyl-CoA N-acyltransferase n=1 Tax=Cristinia sonorae TaxID=1940300 RepID=A0A8K0UUX3_9AGAR|nr:acyl-CoA N-acyltransferase [Cristinia sonorae]